MLFSSNAPINFLRELVHGKRFIGKILPSKLRRLETISLERYNTGRFAYVIKSYSVERQDIVEPDEDVIFGGSLIGHFGQFMVDALPISWFDDFFRLMGIDFARINDERVHCFNEKYFEDFFVARGFESVAMEKLQVEEQISLIMGADEIAANFGDVDALGDIL